MIGFLGPGEASDAIREVGLIIFGVIDRLVATGWIGATYTFAGWVFGLVSYHYARRWMR